MSQPRIKHYDFGVIVINGDKYTRDVIILPDKIISNWWRLEGHRLQLDDIRDYLDTRLDYVVIGTGYYGYMRVDDTVLREFEKRGVEVYVDTTRKAVEKYNELVDKGYRVAAFLHLTC